MLSRTEIEQGVARSIKAVAGFDPEAVLPERPLLAKSLQDDLDLDSLSMVELAEEIEATYGLPVPEERLAGFRTIGDVVDYLDELAGSEPSAVTAGGRG